MAFEEIKGASYINKEAYLERAVKKEAEKGQGRFINAEFLADLQNFLGERDGQKGDAEVFDAIRKDKYIEDSLLMLRDHDEKTFFHALETAKIARFVIDDCGDSFYKAERKNIIAAALLHDYGKLAVDPDILKKEKNLTDKEFEEIKKHVSFSFDFVRQVNELWGKIVVAHHEHQRDSYPRKSSEIVENDQRDGDERVWRLSRFLAMIDSFEAMTAERPGNPPMSMKKTSEEWEAQFPRGIDQDILFSLEKYYMRENPEKEIDAVFN